MKLEVYKMEIMGLKTCTDQDISSLNSAPIVGDYRVENVHRIDY